MNKQITLSEIIRLLFCFITAFVVYEVFTRTWPQGGEWGTGFGYGVLEPDQILVNLVIFLPTIFLGIFLPAFTAILIGPIFVPRRLKLIAGTLIFYVTIAGRMLDLIHSFENRWVLLGGLVRFSFGLLGAFGAILIWKKYIITSKTEPFQHKPRGFSQGEKHPRISFVILMLSLFSIPATYFAIIVFPLVSITLGLLILLIVSFLPAASGGSFIAIGCLFFIWIKATIVPVWASFKTLEDMLTSMVQFHPAIVMNTVEYRNLNSIIDEVCMKVATKKPTAVILHAEPTIFVIKGKLATFDKIVKGRILALGMPLLKELNSLEIRSILAHEFAHFSGIDRLYSTIVLPIYRNIIYSMASLKEAGDEEEKWWYLTAIRLFLKPSLIFLNVFQEYFSSIDMILVRNRELRADRIAANLYGKEAFSNALIKVANISSHFDNNAEKIALGSGRNFFIAYSDCLKKDEDRLNEYEERALAEIETGFDSPPTLTTRLKNLANCTPIESMLPLISIEEELKKDLLEKEEGLSQKYTKQFREAYEYQWEDVNRTDSEDYFRDERKLCLDESCIGIIENGKCTKCGRTETGIQIEKKEHYKPLEKSYPIMSDQTLLTKKSLISIFVFLLLLFFLFVFFVGRCSVKLLYHLS